MIDTGANQGVAYISYRWWLAIAVCLFGIGIAFGLATPDVTGNLLAEDLTALGELVAMLEPFTVFTAVFIFVKNVSALLFSFIFSPILCLSPVLALAVNGWLLSFVSTIVAQEESLGFVLSGILPHGIIEIPAFIMGEAAALSFGAMALMALVSKERRGLLLPALKKNLRYLLIACLLFLPAAIIETFVTPLLLT